MNDDTNIFDASGLISITSPELLAIVAAALLLLGAALAWSIARRRRAARSLPARLRRVCEDVLAGVLIPNADAGQIHLEYALLTRNGILILDVKDVEGHVFGSEAMQEWTVLTKRRRFTFANPLPALYDRIAAVKRLLPGVPVKGCVGFTRRADFSKGQPPNVLMLDRLLEDLAAGSPVEDGATAERLRAGWQLLREEAVVAQVTRLLGN